jgi:hypothetical protein
MATLFRSDNFGVESEELMDVNAFPACVQVNVSAALRPYRVRLVIDGRPRKWF